MIYLIAYLVCLFIVLGFNLKKLESPFVNNDYLYWVGVVVGCVIAPITLCLMLGYKLHGER